MHPRSQSGFSLIELLVILAIAGVIVGFAATGLVASQRTAGVLQTLDQLESDLRRVRARAASTGEDQVYSAEAQLLRPAEIRILEPKGTTAPLPDGAAVTSRIAFKGGSGLPAIEDRIEPSAIVLETVERQPQLFAVTVGRMGLIATWRFSDGEWRPR